MFYVKILKSLIFILLVSILQPYFDVFLLFRYGPSANCLNCNLLQQTFHISLIYIALPLMALYLLLYLLKWNSIFKFVVAGIVFVVLSFNNLTLMLFEDRIAAWSTYSESEIVNEALMGCFPTMLLQIVLMWAMLNKINLEKKVISLSI